MLLSIFILFQITVIILFGISFFTKQEILWALTAVLAGVLMFTSYHVEVLSYALNSSSLVYQTAVTSYSYPYLMALNSLFFLLAMVLGLFDIFDKYGVKITEKR